MYKIDPESTYHQLIIQNIFDDETLEIVMLEVEDGEYKAHFNGETYEITTHKGHKFEVK